MGIKDVLATAIEQWLPQRENRNLSLLARKTGASYSTLRRIVQREAEPSRDIALRIAQVTMSPSDFTGFVDEHCSDMKRIFLASESVADEIDYTADERFFPIIVLASQKSGTNSEEVVSYFGKDASADFEELVNAGVLRKEGDNWKAPDIDCCSLPLGRKWIKVLADIASKTNDSLKYAAHSYVLWESLSPEAAKEFHKKTARYLAEAAEILADPKNKGDVLVYSGTVYNVMKNAELLQ